MTLFGLGGRGKRAPYQTTMYRIPSPLKPTVEELAATYRDIVGDFEDPEDPELIAAALGAITPTANSADIEAELSEVKQQKLKISKKLVEAEAEIHELKMQASTILQSAIGLKANAGGAIKEEIRKALRLLT